MHRRFSSHFTAPCKYLNFSRIFEQLTRAFWQIYALYERSQKVLVFLVALCAIEISIMAVLIGVTMGHLESTLAGIIPQITHIAHTTRLSRATYYGDSDRMRIQGLSTRAVPILDTGPSLRANSLSHGRIQSVVSPRRFSPRATHNTNGSRQVREDIPKVAAPRSPPSIACSIS